MPWYAGNLAVAITTRRAAAKEAPLTPDLPDIPKVEAAILEMTNAYRAENKRGAVSLNAALAKAARAYADYLAGSGTFSHTADGREPGARAKAAGYAFCSIAENLASNLDSRGFETRALARQTVEGWINSPGHRDNLLAPYVTEIGIAVVRAPDKNPKFITVQLFGRPRTLAYEFQISNASKTTVAYTLGDEHHKIEPSYAVTHTLCMPETIRFEASGSGPKSKAIDARYEATDGAVFVVEAAAGGGVKIAVEKKRRLTRQ